MLGYLTFYFIINTKYNNKDRNTIFDKLVYIIVAIYSHVSYNSILKLILLKYGSLKVPEVIFLIC